MTKVDARLVKLETAGASARVCHCPRVIDYRAGIAEDGGAIVDPELCPKCGRPTDFIRVTCSAAALGWDYGPA
jgi:hypothetical protein